MAGSIRLMASGCPGGPEGNALITQALRTTDVAALSAKYGGNPALPASFAALGITDCRVGFAYDAVWSAALAFASLPEAASHDRNQSCAVSAATIDH